MSTETLLNDKDGFGRWAEEGGMYINFRRTPNGSIEIQFLEVHSGENREIAKCTLANFRVEHLKKWLEGDTL